MFQFQNGAIKRKRDWHELITSEKFQFQNGAIKRQRGCLESRFQHRFNSKMVRLKVEDGKIKALPLKLFQFQNGAIKR